MSHHTSQQPFLFAALPSCTSTPVMNAKNFESVNSSRSSLISSIGSIRSHHNSAHSFYNLSKDSNISNVDLTQSTQYLPYHPYPSVYNHSNNSNISINHHALQSHSIYSMASGVSSRLSLTSSQFSIDKVDYAFGSLPSPCPVPPFSASSSSLPLASSVDTPITTSATSKPKTLPSSPSLPPNNRLQSHSLGQHQQQQKNKQRTLSSTSTSSEPSLPRTVSSEVYSSSLRTHLLPSTGTLGQLPPRKRISSSIPPVDTKIHPQSVRLSPSFPSSRSAAMSSTSPSPVGSSPADGNTFSNVSNVYGSVPSTPTNSRPMAAMAITELILSEAHYLTAIKRVTNALNQATESTLAAGRKGSVTIRSLIDRWTEIMRVHAKFHDDVVSINEDLRETAALINSLLITLEPMLVDHGRELSNSLKKLTRRDQNSEHTFAEWDSALRQPFAHLINYDEWFQRIDPQSEFCKDYRSQLNSVIYKIKMVVETNPQPRNMLRRLSTMARGVIKRRSSVQTLSFGSSTPHTPTTPDTPPSACTTVLSGIPSPNANKLESCQSADSNSSVSLPMPETVRNLAVTDHKVTTNAVMEPASSSNNNNNDQRQEKELPEVPTTSEDSEMKDPATPIAETFLAPIHATRQLQHRASTSSELSSSGTLAVEAAPSVVYSSVSSMYSKTSSSAETLQGRPITSASSLARQTFLTEKENRKATLRIGTSEAIQAKAESLQSPTFATRTSIESLRKASPVKNVTVKKPPVKSLINFWEQVSDPLDA